MVAAADHGAQSKLGFVGQFQRGGVVAGVGGDRFGVGGAGTRGLAHEFCAVIQQQVRLEALDGRPGQRCDALVALALEAVGSIADVGSGLRAMLGNVAEAGFQQPRFAKRLAIGADGILVAQRILARGIEDPHARIVAVVSAGKGQGRAAVVVAVGGRQQPIFADLLSQAQVAAHAAEGIIGRDGLGFPAGGQAGAEPAAVPAVGGIERRAAQIMASTGDGGTARKARLGCAGAAKAYHAAVRVRAVARAGGTLQDFHAIDAAQGEIRKAGAEAGGIRDADAIQKHDHVTGAGCAEVQAGKGSGAAVGLDLSGQQIRQQLIQALGAALTDGFGVQHLHGVRRTDGIHGRCFGGDRHRGGSFHRHPGGFECRFGRAQRTAQDQKERDSRNAHHASTHEAGDGWTKPEESRIPRSLGGVGWTGPVSGLARDK